MAPDCEYSAHEYVEYHRGESNIILSVPHGGNLKPHSIPNRDAGSLVDGQCVFSHKYKKTKDPINFPVRFMRDLNTIELAQGVARELHRLSGSRPHVIINRLYRGKMDPNCDKAKATFCVPAAEDAWTAYHTFIEQAQNTVCQNLNAVNGTPGTSCQPWGRIPANTAGSAGLLLDLHGQVHSEDWIELGYTIPAPYLNHKDFTPEMTSVYSLYRNSCAGVKDIHHLISGELSLGALLSAEGYKVVPSPVFPGPADGHYYAGGFITEMHGSKNGGRFDAIQIESPSSLRSSENVAQFAQVLAQVIQRFVSMHYL